MKQFKVVYLFFICCLLVKCNGDVQCDQYANDLDIISRFPFTVGLDYKQQGPDKSTAILDETNSLVIMIQLRQAGSIVPESVFCLKNLQALDIMNMFFDNNMVPDTLSNLQQLHTLGITNTPITKMTQKLSSLGKLQSLSLDKCSLSYLPNLSQLKNLISVNLPNNKLSELEGLTNVSSLSLYKNQFAEIPFIAVPEALRRLDMNYNPVMDMSYVLFFKNITEIRMAESKIPVIPSHIALLDKLSFLDLSHTQITRVPRSILNLPYLQYLVVQNNAISKEEVDSLKMDLLDRQSKINLLI
ncbi:unnamed protein product [Adineta steineri]|uniref:Leucine-rich repeat domain-containing protein n=1 Tax=Adineta steineri TaxID=433720 RepID=A0A815MBE6_9BILA|nr:unnamed protein product [Adineta steineri]CAF1417102.1 unnamed protein product [Adineta steineri]